MRKYLVITSAIAIAVLTLTFVAAKSVLSKNGRLIELQEELVAEQTDKYNLYAEQYRTVDLGCVKRLNTIESHMTQAHELADSYRATIEALTKAPQTDSPNRDNLDFSLAENQ